MSKLTDKFLKETYNKEEEEENDDDDVYESSAYRDTINQKNLSDKVLSFLEKMYFDLDNDFGKIKNDELSILIKEKFPDCFWADDIISENVARLRQQRREKKMERIRKLV